MKISTEVKEILRLIKINNQERLRLYEEWKDLHEQLLELQSQQVDEGSHG